MAFRRSTPEEKDARQLAKENQKAANEQARAEREFWASPAGQARAAFENGDRVLQLSFDVLNTRTYVIPLSRTGTIKRTSDPSEILNAVCQEGWKLVNGDFVFVQLGSESRDKFMRSGQDIAVHGTVLGYYLFERVEQRP